ncbi:monooxygenase [Streptomyces griseoloalbus]|uniref:FAD-dependent oxidoreductase n=1 Tax=Streptomyces griseoloalbus TaxID=67303 RepID=UPI0033B29672
MGVADRHAIVIGGSVGGLLAARVLTGRFARVTVLDRDELPGVPQARRGVPHGDHGHALLLGGKQQLEEFFPGLGADLVAGGAVPFDPGHDLLMHQKGALRRRFRSGAEGVSATRALLEFALRGRVAALPGLQIRDRTPVYGLTGGPDGATGVVLEDGATLAADLVVNASGRGGASADGWLRALGCEAPATDVVKVGVGYTTRLYRRLPGERLAGGGLLHLLAGADGDKRVASVFAVEGDRWMVTLGGWHQTHAPTDPAGFADFAARLPSEAVRRIVSGSEPVPDDTGRKFTFPAARRRRFERLPNPPARFVTLGDALCSFNPLYAQGMTVAARQAAALGRALDAAGGTGADMVRAYYANAAKAVEGPWQMAAAGDFSHPETTGTKPRGTRLRAWYADRVLLASHVSVPVNRALMDVQQLLVPPTAILRPGLAARALLASRRSPALRFGTNAG